jgi:LacI family transcriptional regulator
VFVNHVFEHQNIGIVATDLERAGRLAVEHQIGKGHTAIAMLNGDDAPPDRRVEGFRAGLTAHGVPIRGEWIRSGRPVREQGYKAALELLSCYPEITAIFAYNDMLALGAIQACHELGRRVPQDCAVVGVNDISLADVTGPPLTTVRLPKYELGRRAMERLLDMLNAPDTSCPPVWMGVELVIRESA